jgi:hypothetical protein
MTDPAISLLAELFVKAFHAVRDEFGAAVALLDRRVQEFRILYAKAKARSAVWA